MYISSNDKVVRAKKGTGGLHLVKTVTNASPSSPSLKSSSSSAPSPFLSSSSWSSSWSSSPGASHHHRLLRRTSDCGTVRRCHGKARRLSRLSWILRPFSPGLSLDFFTLEKSQIGSWSILVGRLNCFGFCLIDYENHLVSLDFWAFSLISSWSSADKKSTDQKSADQLKNLTRSDDQLVCLQSTFLNQNMNFHLWTHCWSSLKKKFST